MSEGFWYVGTPYTKYKDGTKEAYKMACRNTALLINAGIMAFCPIGHGEGLVDHGDIDAKDHDLWMRIDRPFMNAAVGLVVVMADGWQESRGLAEEIRTFRAQGKMIIYMENGVLPIEFHPKMLSFTNILAEDLAEADEDGGILYGPCSAEDFAAGE